MKKVVWLALTLVMGLGLVCLLYTSATRDHFGDLHAYPLVAIIVE